MLGALKGYGGLIQYVRTPVYVFHASHAAWPEAGGATH